MDSNTSTMIVVCSVFCSVAILVLIYLFHKASEYLCSRIALIDWALAQLRKRETLQATFIVAFCILLLGFAWIRDINNGQKEEIRDVMVEKQEVLQNLASANLEILALKDENRFAFQPVRDIPVVKTEVQEIPQIKKEDSSQNKVVLEEEQAKQRTEDAKEQTPPVETEEEKEAALARIKAEIDAIKLSIQDLRISQAAMASEVQASASPIMPDPVDTGSSYTGGGVKITEAVAKIN